MNRFYRRLMILCFGGACAIVCAFCLVVAAVEIYSAYIEGGDSPYLLAWRSVGRRMSGSHLSMVCSNPLDPTPIERTRLIALSWEVCPRVVFPVAKEDVAGVETPIITSAYVSQNECRELLSCGFRVAISNEYVMAWSRDVRPTEDKCVAVPLASGWRELCGVLMSMSLVALLVGWMSERVEHKTYRAWVFAGLVFVILSFLALSHHLVAPNGLGVFAGKAKLVVEACGIPNGFWRSSKYAIYQPGYPPGLVLIVMLANVISGVCGDWIIQLLGPFAMACLALLVVNKGGVTPWGFTMAALLTLSPVALKLSGEFYAEPFAALFLLLGWQRVKAGDAGKGWLIMGLAGLFRYESVLIASLFLLGEVLGTKDSLAHLKWIAAMIAPAGLWYFFCVVNGSGVWGFDFAARPDLWKIVRTLQAAGRDCLFLFWNTGGLFVIGVLLFVGRWCKVGESRITRGVTMSTVIALFVLFAGAIAIGYNHSAHWEWVARGVLPRVFWLSLVIVAFESAQSPLCFTNAKFAILRHTKK